VVSAELIPRIRGSPIVSSIERIFQPITDFIRGNPIVSTASIGAGITGLIAGAAIIRKVRKKGKSAKKRKKKTKATRKTRRKGKRTKAEVRAMRLRNLAKARRARKTGKKKRRIIRGPGLGFGEIKHSGRSTKGKMKLVSFRNKKTGKMVRFKVRK